MFHLLALPSWILPGLHVHAIGTMWKGKGCLFRNKLIFPFLTRDCHSNLRVVVLYQIRICRWGFGHSCSKCWNCWRASRICPLTTSHTLSGAAGVDMYLHIFRFCKHVIDILVQAGQKWIYTHSRTIYMSNTFSCFVSTVPHTGIYVWTYENSVQDIAPWSSEFLRSRQYKN